MRHSTTPGLRATRLLLLALLASATACGSSDPAASHPPSISNLSLYPTEAALNDGGGAVQVSFSVEVLDAGSDVSKLTITVVNAGGATISSFSGEVQNPPDATVGTLSGAVGIPTSTIEHYTVRVQAFDARDQSNVLERAFAVVAGSPAPVLAAISPQSVEAGSSTLTVTVTGSAFLSSSTVLWNGTFLSTTFVDQGTLLAEIPSYDLSYQTSAQVSVYTPAPGGGTSNALTFTITAPAARPAPVLSAISPQAADAGGAGITLTVTGSGFAPASMVYRGGYFLATTFVDAGTLRATLSTYDLSTPGLFPITVVTQAPGGGTSLPLDFKVRVPPQAGVTVLDLVANDVAWDPFQQRLYLSIPSGSAVNPNTITTLDPFSGAFLASEYAGSEPGTLALSDDGRFLYVGHLGASEVSRLSLPDLVPDLSIPLGRNPSSGANFAKSLSVCPGAPRTVAIGMNSTYGTGVTTVFDDATPRAASGAGGVWTEWDAGGGALFATAVYWGDLLVYPVDAAGLGAATTYRDAFYTNVGHRYDPVTGLVYGGEGRAIDPATGQLVGTYAVPSAGAAVAPDPSLGSVFFAPTPNYNSWLELLAFDQAHFTPGVATTLAYIAGPATRLLRWGPDGVAILTASSLVLVRGPAVLPAPASPNPVPELTSLQTAYVLAGSANLQLQVAGAGFVPGSVVTWNGALRSTRRVSATLLVASIPASDLAAAGSATVGVSNPGPGGGDSAPASFSILP